MKAMLLAIYRGLAIAVLCLAGVQTASAGCIECCCGYFVCSSECCASGNTCSGSCSCNGCSISCS